MDQRNRLLLPQPSGCFSYQLWKNSRIAIPGSSMELWNRWNSLQKDKVFIMRIEKTRGRGEEEIIIIAERSQVRVSWSQGLRDKGPSRKYVTL